MVKVNVCESSSIQEPAHEQDLRGFSRLHQSVNENWQQRIILSGLVQHRPGYRVWSLPQPPERGVPGGEAHIGQGAIQVRG